MVKVRRNSLRALLSKQKQTLETTYKNSVKEVKLKNLGFESGGTKFVYSKYLNLYSYRFFFFKQFTILNLLECSCVLGYNL